MRHQKLLSLAPLLLVLLAAAPDAHAYIDPGTGNAVLQAIIAALLGAGLALKLFWQRIRAFFAQLFSKRSKADDPRS